MICDVSTSNIIQNYAISNGFHLHPNLNAGFTWLWPPNGLDNMLELRLGNTYNIVASGYDHRDRIAYSLKLYASINNF